MQTLIVATASSARARLEQELRRRGHDVHVADEIDLAWHLWSEHRHRLVLVASCVRGKTTLDFCRLLWRSPVDGLTSILLIVPAAQDAQQLRPFIDAGVDDWLTEDAPAVHTALRLTLAERRVERVTEQQGVREEGKRLEKERLELEAQIRNVQKLESLGVLAGGVAHDFNNLLVGILGHASLALSDLPPELHVHDTVRQIEAAAMQAAELTTELLTYVGKGKFVLERLDLSRLVAEMGSLLASAVGRKVVLKLNLAEGLPEVVAAPSELRQVVMTLVTSASETIGGQPGRIALSTELVHADRALLASAYPDEELPESDYVSLKVEDSGAGMDQSVRQRIFEPFFSTKFPGHGLGLAAVLGIVRGHRGAVRVESRPGRGTAVHVLLPAAPAS